MAIVQQRILELQIALAKLVAATAAVELAELVQPDKLALMANV